MNCIYFKLRNKKGRRYCYCNLKKKEVTLYCYRECNRKEYKQYKKLQSKQKYKYIPSKGKSYKYYNDISIMPKSSLYSTVKVKGLEKHHIFGGTANRPKSEKYGLFVWLNEQQHRYLTDHPLENLKLKKIAQTAFMRYYNRTKEDFREIFGRNYLK